MASNKVNKILLTPEELKVLQVSKKKRRVTCRDFDWWTLMGLVHKTLLDKVVPQNGKDQGWAYFKISHRGKRFLDLRRKREQSARR